MSGKWDLVLSTGLVLQLAGCMAFGGPGVVCQKAMIKDCKITLLMASDLSDV